MSVKLKHLIHDAETFCLESWNILSMMLNDVKLNHLFHEAETFCV